MTDVKTDEMPGEQQPEVVQKEVVAAAQEQAGEPTAQHAVENGNEAKTEETVTKPEDGTVNNDNSNNNNNADNNNDGNADENTNGKESAALPNDGEVEDQDYAENEVYKKLRLQSVKPKVAVALIQLYESTEMSPDDMDERAIDMLRSFPVDHAIFVIGEVSKSNLLGVQNHAQFMMSVMRNFRDKVRQMGAAQALSESLVQGPSYESVKAILDRTGYQLEVTNGQRKYGGPPPDWDGPATGPTGAGHEIYIGKIPNEIYEDALIPLFEECGKMWDLRLMMDPLTGKNRGYAFVTYCDKNSAAEAAKKYDGHEILPGKCLKVNVSIANTRLFIGNIPKSKSKEEILAEFKEHAEGVTDVIIYSSPDAGENRKNRGFCFLDFCDHKSASDAKRKIHAGKLRAWNLDLVVDWAEQQEEPDEETMAKVKVLYVRNLKEAVSEAQLKEMFATHGEVDHVKKIKDYAFVHFVEREPAIKAMEALNGTVLEGIPIEISLAKPQSEKKKVVRGRGRGFGSAARSTGMGGGQFSDYGGGYGGRTGAQAGGGMMRGGGRVPPSAGYGGVRSGAGYGTAPVDYGYGAYDPYAGYDETYGYGAPGAGYGGYGTAYDSYGYGSGADAYSYGYGNASQMRGGSGGRGGGRGGGFNTSSFMPRGSAGRGRSVSRSGGGSGRGAKRAADGMGGPATKREFGGDMM